MLYYSKDSRELFNQRFTIKFNIGFSFVNSTMLTGISVRKRPGALSHYELCSVAHKGCAAN